MITDGASALSSDICRVEVGCSLGLIEAEFHDFSELKERFSNEEKAQNTSRSPDRLSLTKHLCAKKNYMKLKLILSLLIGLTFISCGRRSTIPDMMSADPPELNINRRSQQIHFLADSITVRDESGIEMLSIYPELAINSIDELDEWIESNGSINIAYFKLGNAKPLFSLNENLLRYLVVSINESDRKAYKLVGHTHSQGNAEKNMKLSIDRSRYTLELLVNNFRLDLSRMPAIGEGETNPIADNNTEIGKRNSRVELRKMN